jgi:hypothetical protein
MDRYTLARMLVYVCTVCMHIIFFIYGLHVLLNLNNLDYLEGKTCLEKFPKHIYTDGLVIVFGFMVAFDLMVFLTSFKLPVTTSLDKDDVVNTFIAIKIIMVFYFVTVFAFIGIPAIMKHSECFCVTGYIHAAILEFANCVQFILLIGTKFPSLLYNPVIACKRSTKCSKFVYSSSDE